jgi:hypothetical protein
MISEQITAGTWISVSYIIAFVLALLIYRQATAIDVEHKRNRACDKTATQTASAIRRESCPPSTPEVCPTPLSQSQTTTMTQKKEEEEEEKKKRETSKAATAAASTDQEQEQRQTQARRSSSCSTPTDETHAVTNAVSVSVDPVARQPLQPTLLIRTPQPDRPAQQLQSKQATAMDHQSRHDSRSDGWESVGGGGTYLHQE